MGKDPSEFVAVERALWSSYGITPRERRVRLRAGNEVRVQEVGTGPPIVFVHGVSVAGTSWLTLVDALKDDYRCVLVDRPGCGLSDPVPNGPLRTSAEFKRHAEDLVPDVLDGLGLDAVPVACTSMGGFFGFRAAIAHPDRVTSLVLYSWAMGSPMGRVPMMMRLGSPAPMRAMMVRMPITPGVVKMMLKQVGLTRAIDSGAFDDAMVDWTVMLMKHTPTLDSETDNNPFISLRGENPEVLFTDDELGNVDLPVLLLWGDEDAMAGEAEAHAFASRLPNATLDVVRDAGHAPWLDQLEHCVAKTQEFLGA
jgi:pimeloyl-ACP methyl ester carboxylesterase